MSSRKIRAKEAIAAIDRLGMCLVFPLANAKEPPSLWSSFFPKTEMCWEWDEGGDTRVSDLWHLRAELSSSSRVIYTKWYRGRATFISRELFPALARALNLEPRELVAPRMLGSTARNLLKILESDSPLSTKALKQASGLKGHANEAAYTRGLKELWERLRIVGFGEVDDGAFPSLAVGATPVLFEDLWQEAQGLSATEAERRLAMLPEGSAFGKFLAKLQDNARKAKPQEKAAATAAAPYISFTDA